MSEVTHKDLLDQREWFDQRLDLHAERLEKAIDDKVTPVAMQGRDHEKRLRSLEESDRKTSRLMLIFTAAINGAQVAISRLFH